MVTYEELKIYAPCDCIVKDFQVSEREDTKEKNITIVINPQSELIFSPFSKANIVIDSGRKNVISFLDYNNKLWDLNYEQNFKLSIVNIHLQNKFKIKKRLAEIKLDNKVNNIIRLSTSLKTSEVEKIYVATSKTIRQGELMIHIKYVSENKLNPLSQNNKRQLKYYELCSQLFNSIGKKENYTNVNSCMTRLRFNIIDKSKVDTSMIQKLDLVKGCNWAGDELQIIIGTEVYKVLDDYKKYEININQPAAEKKIPLIPKKRFKEKAYAFISAILIPNIPILMAAGMLMALQSILVQSKVIEEVNLNQKSLTDYSLVTGIIYIMSQTIFSLMGIFICYNTTKHFGGNPLVGIAIGLMLASSFMIGSNQKYLSWTLFKIKDQSINVQAYTSAIIPQMMAGILYSYLDRWIKTWIPTNLDVIFRPTIAILVTVSAIFLLFGPFLLLLEKYIVMAINWVGKAPYGVGVAILALLWQPLVITGMHLGIVIPLILVLVQGNPSTLLPAISIAVWAQVGAVLGIFINSKNPNTKQVALGAMSAGVFGITEPAIYGLNLPRVKPFLIACGSACIIGLLSGLLNVKTHVPGGLGVFAVIGTLPGGTRNIAFYILCQVLVIVFVTLLIIIFCKESKSEKTLIKSTSKQLLRLCQNLLLSNSELSKDDLSVEVNRITQLISNADEKLYKEYHKTLIKLNKLRVSLKQIKAKEDILHRKYHVKFEKVKVNEKAKQLKLESKVRNLNATKRRLIIEHKLNKLNQQYEHFQSSIRASQAKFLDEVIVILANLAKKLNSQKINQFYNKYFNVIYQLDIDYKIIDLKPAIQIKNPNKLMKRFKRSAVNVE